MAHTQLPWCVWSEEGQTKTGRFRNSVCFQELTTEGWPEGEHVCIADVLGDTEAGSLDNAAFIVLAVNSHDALVEALTWALGQMSKPTLIRRQNSGYFASYEAAVAALALATPVTEPVEG